MRGGKSASLLQHGYCRLNSVLPDQAGAKQQEILGLHCLVAQTAKKLLGGIVAPHLTVGTSQKTKSV